MKEQNFWELTNSEKTYELALINDLFEKYSIIYKDNKLLSIKLQREFTKAVDEAFAKCIKPQSDKIIGDIDCIYTDIQLRFNLECWKKIFDNEYLKDKYSFEYIRNEILAYLMYHEYLSKAVWEFIDNALFIMRDYNKLKAIFPITFLQRIKNMIAGGSFFEYERLEKIDNSDDEPDEYIRTLFELGDTVEFENNDNKVKELMIKLDNLGFYHICYDVEIMNYFVKRGIKDTEIEKLCNKLKNDKNPYIKACVGWAMWYLDDIDEADNMWIDVLEEHPYYAKAALGHINYLYETECYEQAKDCIFNLIEYTGETDEIMKLLADINEIIMKQYLDLYEENPDDLYDAIQYAWCLCQSSKWDEAIEFLTELEVDEIIEYDVNMLIGRAYFSKGCYAQAIPYLQKWVKIMMLLPCDGSEEYQEKIERYPAGLAVLSEAFYETQNIEKAIYYMEQSMYAYDINDPERIKSITRLADFYNEIGEFDKAFLYAQEAIQADEYCIWAYIAHQKAAFELYNTAEVIRDYFVISSIAPDVVDSYVYASMVYIYNNMYEDAELVIERASLNGIYEKSFEIMSFLVAVSKAEISEVPAIENEFEKIDYLDNYKRLVVKFYSIIKDKYLAASNKKSAIAYIDKILSIEPDNVYYKWEKGDIYFHNDEDATALQIYDSIKDELEDNIGFLCDYIECLQYNNKWDESLNVALNALKLENSGVADLYISRYYKNLYNKSDLREDYENAKKYINIQLEKTPDHLFSVMERVYLFKYAEDEKAYDIAINDLKRLIYENYGEYSEWKLMLAEFYIKKGLPQQALDELENINSDIAALENIYKVTANAYKRMNDKAMEEQTYRIAYQKTKSPYFAKEIANICTEQGKYRTASIWYKKYLSIENVDIDKQLLRFYFLNGNKVKLKKLCKNIFNEISKNNVDKVRCMAWHLFAIEFDAESAIERMKATIKYTDNIDALIDVYSSLSLYYRYINDNENAVLNAKTLYELLKQKGEGSIDKYLDVVYGKRDRIDNMVLYYIGINDFDTAEEYAKKMICGTAVCAWCNEPCCIDAYYRFAQIKMLRGDFTSMQNICHKILEIDSENRQATIYLENMKEIEKQYENYRRC